MFLILIGIPPFELNTRMLTISSDPTAFINELEFRNILAFRIVLLSEALMTYNRLRDALVKLQRQIDQELTA